MADSSLPAGWEVVEESASAQPQAPKPTSAIPDGWEVVEDTPTKSGGEGALMTGGALATLAGAVPVVRGLAERIATSPAIGATVQRVAPAAAGLNVAKLGYDIYQGKNPLRSVWEAAKNEGLRRGGLAAYRAAAPIAEGLATPAAAFGAGGLAGLAGTAGFLGALQHDANRHVDIDYSKNTPDTWIARVLGGRSADERMDDPNDPMFKPDDTEMVRAAVMQGLR